MSDDEGGAVGVGPGEDSDLALPKATVGKFVSGARCPATLAVAFDSYLVPILVSLECVPGKTVAKDARDLVAACCKGQSSI